MGLSLLPSATVPEEPVDLGAAKLHLREDGMSQDALIAALITAAREHAEAITRRALVRQSWRLTLDGFPANGIIEIPLPPLVSVTGITYLDAAGTTQTLDPTTYVVDVDTLPGRIRLAYNAEWPITRGIAHAVTVTFVAGYLPSEIPASIQAAIKLIAGTLYEHRETFVTGTIATELPFAAKSLLWPHRYLGDG